MTTSVSPAPSPRLDRWFFPVMAIFIAATVFAGFSATFYTRHAELPPLPGLLVVHGVAFTGWILLFITQTSLIAGNQTEPHKKLGWVGAALAVTMVTLGMMAAVRSLKLGRAPIPGLDPRSFFAVPVFDLISFITLVAAGVKLRNSGEAHRRVMFVATLAILDAAIARIPLHFIAAGGPPIFFLLTDLFLFAGWGWDLLTHRRIHKAFLWAGLFLILSQPLRLVIGGTGAWKAFANLFLP